MKYQVQIGDRSLEVEANGSAEAASAGPQRLSIIRAGRSYTFSWRSAGSGVVWLAGGGREFTAEVRDPRRLLAQRRVEQSGRARVTAPMAGKVVRLVAAPGDAVEAGQPLLVLEAMKMQNEVRSPKTGTLITIAVAAGDTVATGQPLADVE
ncbi:MAG: biotin/lipoyl-containing protein [Terriglobales bacterium]